MSRYRYALRPLWILSHVLVVGLVVLMVNLGAWQLRRMDDRRDFNDLVEANLVAEPVAAAELLGSEPERERLAELEWRRVVASGAYRSDLDVLVANRALDGQPGAWVVTPLTTADGPTVAVMRGFVPLSVARSDALAGAAAPAGQVEVVGLVQRSREGGRFARQRDGQPVEISSLDLVALRERWGVDVAPYWLHLVEQRPAVTAGGVLRPVPVPDVDAGPHLGYAVQWFIFATIALIGYPLVLRRNAGDGKPPPVPETPSEDPHPVAANGAGPRASLR